jgi:hypothetical protein
LEAHCTQPYRLTGTENVFMPLLHQIGNLVVSEFMHNFEATTLFSSIVRKYNDVLIPDSFFFFLSVRLGFELRALHLQSRHSTASCEPFESRFCCSQPPQ